MNLIDLFNNRLDSVLHNTMKLPFFYFFFLFSIAIILFSPFYIKINKTKPFKWILSSLFISIIVLLFYFIYVSGGFNV